MENETSALLRQWHFRAMHLETLVARMRDYLHRQEASPAYSGKAIQLLRCADDQCLEFDERLRQFSETVDGFHSLDLVSDRGQDLDGEIASIARDFRDTHVLVRLISPSSVFDIPSPFVLSLRELARRVKAAVSVVVIPLPVYNYGQLRRWAVPDEFCLLSMPYTGHQDLLGGTILFHELGHFVAQAIGFATKLLARAPREVEQAASDIVVPLARCLGTVHASRDWLLGKARNTIYSWCEEAFADCFGLRCAGPAYTAAMLSFPWPPVDERDETAHIEHPPLENRVHLVLRCDGKLGLHELWEDGAAWVLQAAQRLAGLTPGAGALARTCWEHLLKLFPTVEDVLDNVCRTYPGLAFDLVRFGTERREVNANLSDLTTAGQVLCKSTFIPEWRTILNVAWEIALAGFKEWHRLLETVGDQAETHVEFAEKLCALGLKSIEDSMICERWEGAANVRFGP